MSGKLKTKGNMMLATKLDGVLKVRWCLLPFATVAYPCYQAAKATAKL